MRRIRQQSRGSLPTTRLNCGRNSDRVIDPDSLFAQLEANRGRSLPPVDRWHPARSGVSQIRIGADGAWFYRESEIRRPEMVRLFSTILRRDPDGFVLVTPAERLSILVDESPFVAVDGEARGSGRD